MASKCEDSVFSFSEDGISDLVNSNLNLKMLKLLDEALRCRICYDYFSNCMMTKCSHNYCSKCIRTHMLYKSQCPTCFQNATEPELRNNRLIDEILRLYKKVRESLQIPAPFETTVKTEHTPDSESVNIKIKKEPSTSSHEEKAEDSKDSRFPEVSCPVCYKTMPDDRINTHLDKCLQNEEKESERRSLPKLVYHLLSDKDIRKKLKEHGLSSSGDRQKLIRRHKNFVTLYNANCDSLEPKSIEELVMEIECQEIEERVNSAPKVQINKKSDITDIEKEQKTYVKQHQSQFNSLIHNIQQRSLGQKVVKQEVQEECSEYSDSQPSKTIDHDDDDLSSTVSNDSSSDSDSIPLMTESYRTPKKTRSRRQKAKKGKEIVSDEDVNSKALSNEINELPFSKSLEKFQDTYTNDTEPLDDFDHGKITNLSLLRKRKKGRIRNANPTSPKKK